MIPFIRIRTVRNLATLGLAGLVAARPLLNLSARKLSGARPKRLWMVNHYAVTPDLPGGTRHSDLAEILQDHGWQTTIFASSFNHNTHRLERPIRLPWPITSEKTAEATWRWIPTFPYESNDWRRYLGMVSFSGLFIVDALFRKRPDVILGSSGHLLAPLGAWIASRWYGTPFFFEVRDVWPDGLIELGLDNKPVIAALKWVEKFLYRRADKIIVVADGIKERLMEKGVPGHKIVSIYHGVKTIPTALSREEREEFRRKLGWDDKLVAIWLGGLQPMNGLDTLVDAAKLIEDESHILIVFVGGGSEKESLERRAGGANNIRFYGTVPKADVAQWLGSADIGVVTARKYDAVTGVRARKVLDYMAAGLPVISTIPGETQRMIEESGAGLVTEWERPDLLAESIMRLASSTDSRSVMAFAGKNAVLTTHSIGASGSKLAQILAEAR